MDFMENFEEILRIIYVLNWASCVMPKAVNTSCMMTIHSLGYSVKVGNPSACSVKKPVAVGTNR